ncbi:MAG: indole-3-glycerol phosphate synthase TrpC [Ktedonobacterales bacterium]
MADTFLDRLVAATREVIAERQAQAPLDAVREQARQAPAPRDFASAVQPAAGGPARLIAEVKRASPSKGLLAERFEPVEQAQAYAAGGAAAISVLTEPRFFLGSLDHLQAVRAAVDVPVLRKDFILDPYQIYEARVAGADAVLLICALLNDAQLTAYLALAHELGREALVEAHNAAETRRAVAAGARVIGVNSRDLDSFAVDTDVVRHLRPLVPKGRVLIAESGIFDAAGVARARAWGADVILVGEALMRAPDPTAKARELATAAGGGTAALFGGSGHPFVKICGLQQPEHAALAAGLGADAFGLIFAPMAKPHRRVSPEQAVAVARAARRERGDIRAVGVFVNETPTRIAEIAREVGLDVVQLSGNETPEQCSETAALGGKPVVKVVRLRTEEDLAQIDAYALAGATILLDTPATNGAYGGTGETGDWRLAREAAARWPVILSGGLTPENVMAGIEAVVPRGVDVSSGVETGNAKDERKIAAFIEAARATQTT